MADYIFFAVIFIFEFAIFYFLPVFNGSGTVFGLVLDETNFDNEGLQTIRHFRRDLLILFLISIAVTLTMVRIYPQCLAILYILANFLTLALMFRYFRKSWKMRDKKIISRFAASMKPRDLKKFSNLWLESGVVVLTLFPFFLLTFYYSQLPESIPVHWNLSGEPDRWEQKSFFSVFFPSLLALWLQVFLVIIKNDIVQARFRVPSGETAAHIVSLKETSLLANVGLIDWCRLLCGSLMASVSLLALSVIETDFPFASGINSLVWASLTVLLGGIAFFIFRMILINREIKAVTGQITFQTADEMAGWDAGGLYYYNPNDTAFMVEKPGGMGYTLNFAHKRFLIYLLLILSPMLFVFFEAVLSK